MLPKLDLQILPGDYAVSLLPIKASQPDWFEGDGFRSISFCEDETTVVCLSERVPAEVQSDEGWTAIKLVPDFAFDDAGVALSVVKPISEKGLGVFLISTFQRDYLLVKSADLEKAIEHLEHSGHRIVS